MFHFILEMVCILNIIFCSTIQLLPHCRPCILQQTLSEDTNVTIWLDIFPSHQNDDARFLVKQSYLYGVATFLCVVYSDSAAVMAVAAAAVADVDTAALYLDTMANGVSSSFSLTVLVVDLLFTAFPLPFFLEGCGDDATTPAFAAAASADAIHV